MKINLSQHLKDPLHFVFEGKKYNVQNKKTIIIASILTGLFTFGVGGIALLYLFSAKVKSDQLSKLDKSVNQVFKQTHSIKVELPFKTESLNVVKQIHTPLVLNFVENNKRLSVYILKEGNLIGTIQAEVSHQDSTRQDYLHILSIQILENEQGKGYGKQAFSSFIDYVDKHPKFNRLSYFLLETVSLLEPAVRTFTSAGFEAITKDDPRWPENLPHNPIILLMVRSPKSK